MECANLLNEISNKRVQLPDRGVGCEGRAPYPGHRVKFPWFGCPGWFEFQGWGGPRGGGAPPFFGIIPFPYMGVSYLGRSFIILIKIYIYIKTYYILYHSDRQHSPNTAQESPRAPRKGQEGQGGPGRAGRQVKTQKKCLPPVLNQQPDTA